MSSSELALVVADAVAEGLAAAAVLDREGNVIASAGALTSNDTRALASFVTLGLKGDDLARKLLDGELCPFSFDERDMSVGVAGKCVFVVAIFLPSPTPAARNRARALYRDAERIVRSILGDIVEWSPPGDGGSGGPGSGPAELPVLEIGVTPGVSRRERGKA